jgi:glycosyltransferase involved in cell wall biosynthesis
VAVNILHVHSTFTLGGKEARAVRLMNAFGARAQHTIISTVAGALTARAAIADGVVAAFPDDHPPFIGKPSIGRYMAIARYLQKFDLILTYNWGAMDAVGAHRLCARMLRLPPLIHHEDGFNQDEAQKQNPARIWFRRLTLQTAYAMVVPSHTLERIALTSWRQPKGRLLRIANGIALDRYGPAGAERARSDELVVGTIAGLRAVKNLPRLVRAFAASGIGGRLRIIGEGPERNAILQAATEYGVADRIELPGFNPDPAVALRDIDIFALSSDSEQQPISLIEAMASGLPVVSTDVGDVREMVSEANLPLILPPVREDLFAEALSKMAANMSDRLAIGAANRAKALQFFDEKTMVDRYRALYEAAMGQLGALAGDT